MKRRVEELERQVAELYDLLQQVLALLEKPDANKSKDPVSPLP